MTSHAATHRHGRRFLSKLDGFVGFFMSFRRLHSSPHDKTRESRAFEAGMGHTERINAASSLRVLPP